MSEAVKVICDKQELVNIADAIREKGGTTDTLAFSAMADAIAAIEAGGAIYLGSITPSAESTTLSIVHNLNSPAREISFIIFATDTSRPSTNVHAIMRWIRSIKQTGSTTIIDANNVTYWSTYAPHSTQPVVTEISTNEMTVANTNSSYGFGAGRTYIVAAWAWEALAA